MSLSLANLELIDVMAAEQRLLWLWPVSWIDANTLDYFFKKDKA